MRLLIIWEESGDRLRLYEELVTPDEFKAMSAAHGQFINTCGTSEAAEKALHFLSEWLMGKEPFYDTREGNQPVREILPCSVLHAGFLP